MYFLFSKFFSLLTGYVQCPQKAMKIILFPHTFLLSIVKDHFCCRNRRLNTLKTVNLIKVAIGIKNLALETEVNVNLEEIFSAKSQCIVYYSINVHSQKGN